MALKRRRKQSQLMVHAKWAIVGAAIADIACLGAGYYFYKQMKTSPEFRHKVYNYDERYLDMYYRANEKYGDGKAREQDFKEWGIKKINSFSFVSLVPGL